MSYRDEIDYTEHDDNQDYIDQENAAELEAEEMLERVIATTGIQPAELEDLAKGGPDHVYATKEAAKEAAEAQFAKKHPGVKVHTLARVGWRGPLVATGEIEFNQWDEEGHLVETKALFVIRCWERNTRYVEFYTLDGDTITEFAPGVKLTLIDRVDLATEARANNRLFIEKP